MTTEYAVFIGLDVGKSGHHACALDRAGKKLFDKTLKQDEQQLRRVYTDLAAHGPVLLIVDQPNTIGALPVAVARDVGCAVAYLPGLAMRKAADLYPGKAKTDSRDAFIIANTARTMPHTLRQVDRDSEVLAALKVLAGFDEDLAHESTRALNRLRSLLTQIHPALERVFAGGTLSTKLALDLLAEYGGPTGLHTAGRDAVTAYARDHSRRNPDALINRIFAALDEQTVIVPATATVELVIPRVAAQAREIKAQRAQVAKEVEAMLDDFPLAEVLMSMPGIGIKTAASILLTVGDGSAFPDADHLASYAGIAPVTRRSGTSIKGEFPARAGNKTLKNALYYSAWVASRSHPESRTYYQRKRDEGKRNNAAVMCLARRRCNVIYAMLKNRTHYQPNPQPSTPSGPTIGTGAGPVTAAAA